VQGSRRSLLNRLARGYALNKGKQKVAGRGGFAAWKWIRLSLLVWIVFLTCSCSKTLEDVRLEQNTPEAVDVSQEPEPGSLREAEFRFAIEMLENGDFQGARETLDELAKPENEQEVSPEVVFAIGVVKLLEMEDVERMRGCRDYFQSFTDQHPTGPYREDAERIVQVLNSQLVRVEKEQRRIAELTRKVGDQEKVIQTLQYKIEKLEEIHRETEEKRHLTEGE
jgi:hypothetical protein